MGGKNAASGGDLVLEMKKIDKRFTGVHALKGVDFQLRRGEIHALCGENGAGKSTLMKILTGIYSLDSGEIIYNGNSVHFKDSKHALESGISMVHQELNMMNHLTAAQNIYIGRESKGAFLNDKAMNKKCQDLANHLGLDFKPTQKVGDLTVGKQQMVEIAKAVSYDADVVVLDEPTAALTEREIEELFKIMNELKSKNVAIIYISHRLEEIKQITDRVTVMRDGEYIGTMDSKECTMDDIINMMVGRTIYEEPKTESNVSKDAPVVLEVKNIISNEVKDVSFQLRKGEILGFAGLMGAGRTELARLIFGADPKASGEIFVQGKKVNIKSPADAVKNGIGYLSEDRKRFGLATGLSIVDNVVLASLENYSMAGFVSKASSIADTKKYIETINIKTPSATQLIKNLSGGNQQKVVIAKWLIRDSDILIFDEPTRGIDVGAKSEIYKLMNELVNEGKSIIMISSEMPELLRMSDRIMVMREGRKTGELDISEATQEAVMRLATAQN